MVLKPFKILKVGWLTSTARGYDIIIKDEYPHVDGWGRDATRANIRIYKNVTRSTMRRFYNLSHNMMEIVVSKSVDDVIRFLRLFPVNHRRTK